MARMIEVAGFGTCPPIVATMGGTTIIGSQNSDMKMMVNVDSILLVHAVSKREKDEPDRCMLYLPHNVTLSVVGSCEEITRKIASPGSPIAPRGE